MDNWRDRDSEKYVLKWIMLFGSLCSYEVKQSLQKKIVAHTHSEFFPAMAFYLQTWESIYCLKKNCQLEIRIQIFKNSSMKNAKTVLANKAF